MSPDSALHSQVFRTYVLMIAGLLLIAGVALVFMSRGLGKDVHSIWITYRSWLILTPLYLGSVFAGRGAMILTVTLVALFGFKEFARATGLYRDWPMTLAGYVGILSTGLVSLARDPSNSQAGWYGLFMTLPVFVVAFLLLIPIARDRSAGQLQQMSLAILGFTYIGWMFGHLGFLANAPDAYGYLLYLAFAVEINDVAAFLFGRLFGRHPLRKNISPNKTWEGALGALAVSMVLPWILHFSFPLFGPGELLLTGLIVGAGGQLGDLSISVIKRDLGIKDMGALIPGHGGILDRIDSLIYVAPLFLHAVNCPYKFW